MLSLNAAQYTRLPLRSASPAKGLVRLSGAAAPEPPLPAARGFLLRGGGGIQCYALCNAGREALCAVKRWALCNGARYAALRAVHRFICAELKANAIVYTL